MWYPEPHDSGEPQIGDVGYVREGAFVRFFNIDTSKAEHVVSYWEPQFEIQDPLPADVFRVDKRRAPLGPGPYVSQGVQEKEIRGSVSASA